MELTHRKIRTSINYNIEHITWRERIHELWRIWIQPRSQVEVWSSAIGYRPDGTYTRFQIVRGVHVYSKRIR